MNVLVAYGSSRGGTAGIADMVAGELRAGGLSVDVRPASEAIDVRRYHAVIVGGALYANRWHRDARRFVRRNAGSLADRPVWLFSSGPLDASASAKEIPATPQVQRLARLVHAQGHATFGGRLAADARGFPARALARTHSGDWRDQRQVASWARQVARSVAEGRRVEVKEGPTRAVRPPPWAAIWLSAFALLAAAAASAITLAWDGAFPPPSPGPPSNGILGEARGWSAVTLALAIPLGVHALLRAWPARLRAMLTLAGIRTHLVRPPARLRAVLTLAGVQAYLLYTYLEMAVSQPFTPLYLLYVATFATALPALVLTAGSVNVAELPAAFTVREPRRAVAAFALLYSVVLSAAWLKDILERSFAAQFGWRDAYGSVAHVVHALDLGLQVPLGIATAVLLWTRRPSGYLVGAICVVMAACMGPALAAMVTGSALISGTTLLAAVPFAGLAALSAALALLFFRAMRDEIPAPG